jgi:hypothetical protein
MTSAAESERETPYLPRGGVRVGADRLACKP